jgi:hypothetical protein
MEIKKSTLILSIVVTVLGLGVIGEGVGLGISISSRNKLSSEINEVKSDNQSQKDKINQLTLENGTLKNELNKNNKTIADAAQKQADAAKKQADAAAKEAKLKAEQSEKEKIAEAKVKADQTKYEERQKLLWDKTYVYRNGKYSESLEFIDNTDVVTYTRIKSNGDKFQTSFDYTIDATKPKIYLSGDGSEAMFGETDSLSIGNGYLENLSTKSKFIRE